MKEEEDFKIGSLIFSERSENILQSEHKNRYYKERNTGYKNILLEIES